jgi:hypothetical protein
MLWHRKRWMFLAKHGYPFSYFYGARPMPEVYLSDELIKLYGITRKEDAPDWKDVHDDFCDPEFLTWFIGRAKAVLDTYHPDGIYWDMGWDTHVSPCSRHPDTGIHHGELRAIHDVYEYAKAKYPQMRFLINQNINSPCMLYVDGAFINEGGLGADNLSIQTNTFWQIPLTCLFYPSLWQEKQMMTSALRLLSYGIPYAGTGLKEQMPEYRNFSAMVTSLHLVWERDAVTVSPSKPEVSASVWADSGHLLSAIHNPGPGKSPIEVSILKPVLTSYNAPPSGQMKFMVLKADGAPGADSTFCLDSDNASVLKIRGELGEGDTVLGTLEAR